MKISMAGVDYKNTPLFMREKIAFSENDIKRITEKITNKPEVSGCVVISTCNRTEIYISGKDELDAAGYLFRNCNAQSDGFNVYKKYNSDAVNYLCEVGCGLHSAILCEEQIVTQLRDAARVSRDAGGCDAVLNTAFRCAVTAGKRALTDFSVSSVPISSASAAIDKANELFGGLNGKKALVIGNGKMGIAAAESLLNKGCEVCITLRQYKHGENYVPKGVETIPFSERMTVLKESDLVITATRSPHYTIHKEDIAKCESLPRYIFDLAVPCDVEKGTEDYVKCFNIDDLRVKAADDNIISDIRNVAKKYTDDFIKWKRYKESL